MKNKNVVTINQPIFFIVFFNIIVSILLMVNELGLINLESIYIHLIYNLLITWNIILIYLLSKKST